MATCPRCKGSIDIMASICPHCGYDFPLTIPKKEAPRGLAHSDFAGVVLGIGAIFAFLGAVALLVLVVISLLVDNWAGVFYGVGGFFIFASLYVVFQRALDDK